METTLTIRLFGPMLVLLGDEPLPRLRSRKALWLLALLSTRPNRPVAREWLATTLWPDVDLAAAFANLRPVVSELRRALGEHGERVRSPDRNTVLLDLDGADLDVERFDAAIRKEDFAAAVDLYRGPLLEDCTEEWAPQERAVREADCLRALQALGERALAAGDPDAAVARFTRAILLDAWRDAPRRGLMAALAAKGDVNAALQAYRDFAHLLSAEAGSAPDAATTELYARLRREAKRGARRPAEVESERSAPKVSGYLPHPLTDLVGREDERLDLAARLRASRLVTLVGPGGIGKTRLATAVAHDVAAEHPDGVWLVSLEGFADDRMVVKEVAATLEISEEAGRSPLQSLTRALRDRRALIVLDNCEHVLDAGADLVATLLRDCGDVRVLATSREPLGLTGERVWPVPPLAAPNPEGLPEGRATLLRVMMGYESVRLFTERAQAVSPSFEVTPENARAVATICARLEGVPLALELAAARVRALTPAQVAERLDDGLRLLAGGRGSANKRQQTLRATLDWSHGLLDAEHRRLLRRLGAFADGWTLEAAEIVAGGDAAEGLAALVDKSLVVFDERRGRYRFLETVRQYAVERLEASGERAATEARLRAWAVDLAARAEAAFHGPAQSEWADRLDPDLDNLRAAFSQCIDAPEDGLALAGALTRYWYFRNRYAEGREMCEAALDRPGAEGPTEARAKALNGAGTLAYAQGDLDAAETRWSAYHALRVELGDPAGIASAVGNLGGLAFYRREYAKGAALYAESLALYRDLGDRRGAAMALSNLGTMRKGLGDYRGARECAAESLALFRELADERMVCWLLKETGDLAHVQADYGAARAYFEEALARFRESGDENGAAWALNALAFTLAELGLDANAAELRTEAHRLFTELRSPSGLAAVAVDEGAAAFRRGDLAAVRARLEPCLAQADDPHLAQRRPEILLILGDAERAEGHPDLAGDRYREALALSLEDEARLDVAAALERLGVLAADEGEPAVRLLAAAESLRESLGAPLPDSARPALSDALGALRARLGKVAFDAAWREGRETDGREAANAALAGVRETAGR